MGFILLLLMIVVPIGEIAVFIEAGDQFGFLVTLGIVVLTAIVGASFLRLQGLGVLRRVQESLARGENPVSEMFDGLCLLVAGALLLTPGFITDGLGFALLVTPFRRAIAAQITRPLMRAGRVAAGSAQGPHTTGPGPRGTVIDGEFEEVSPDDKDDDDDRAPHNRRIEP